MARRNFAVPRRRLGPGLAACLGFLVLATLGRHSLPLPAAGAAGVPVSGDIAFVSDRAGTWDIWLVQPDGGGARNVTGHPATDGYPAWSPDGGRLAFASDRTGNWDIFSVAPDGSGLANVTASAADERFPSWSPDGKSIAFTEGQPGDGSSHTSVVGRIGVLDLGTGARRVLADGAFPAWSPDGARIAYAGPVSGGADIFVIGASGGQPFNVSDRGGRSLWPSWAPDGSRIAYWGNGDDIFVVDPDGADHHLLTDGSLYSGAPAWSPDGSRIAFLRVPDGAAEEDIFTMAADGDDIRRVTSHPGYDAWPAWQPAASAPSTTTTATPPTPTSTTLPGAPPGTPPPPASVRSGYWMVTAAGAVHGFGDAAHLGNAPAGGPGPVVDIEPTPSGDGYYLLDAAGGLHPYGAARLHGTLDRLGTGERATSLSVTVTGNGYWLFTSWGRVAAFGDAGHFGDMSGVKLNGPVLDSVATASGQGYWMVAADGGIFSFGDARFYGSMGGQPLNQPVMSMAPDPDGIGYWLVASDGGIFAFEAPFHGSLGAIRLNRPVSGMLRGTAGYLMVAEDGGIFTFGDVRFHGSLGNDPPLSPVVAVAVFPNNPFVPTTPSGDPGSRLSSLRRANEGPRAGYDRALFDHWIDADGDGCDTRREVLIAESRVPAGLGAECAVTGDWFSAYDGISTTVPSDLDVDHVVALAEAWDSGAWAWDPARRREFANDLGYPGSLIAVSASSNRSKGAGDPAEWLPPRREAWCAFATDWVTVKQRWDLAADDREVEALTTALGTCGGAVPPPTTTTTTSAPSPEPYYPNCAAARAAGVAPLHVGEPGYRPGLDGDKDGVACE